MLTKVPDVSVVGVVVVEIGVLLIVLLVDTVGVGPVVVVSGTVDEVGCSDSVFVVIGVVSVTGSVQTCVTYIHFQVLCLICTTIRGFRNYSA